MLISVYGADGRGVNLSDRIGNVLGMICEVRFHSDSWMTIRLFRGKAVSFRYETALSDGAETTVEIELLYQNKPYEGLLGRDDFEEKRRRGEPENGRMKGVTLQRLVEYIETLAVTPLENIRPPSC